MKEYKNTGYLVTETGDVIGKRGWILHPSTTSGYKEVKICEDGEITYKRVHQLVAECYIPNIDNLPIVNHKDGNKFNNHKDNLEWSTYKENSEHAVRSGLQKTGEDHYAATITELEVIEVCKLLSELIRVKDIWLILQKKGIFVSRSKISDIKRRKNWKKISKDFSW